MAGNLLSKAPRERSYRNRLHAAFYNSDRGIRGVETGLSKKTQTCLPTEEDKKDQEAIRPVDNPGGWREAGF